MKNLKRTQIAESVRSIGENPNRFYVYALWIDGEAEPFYIGKGKDERPYDHLYPCNYDSPHGNRHKNNTIKKALREGRRIDVYLIEWDLDEEAALELERSWILYYGRKNIGTGCLTNLTDGGEGVSGYRHTLETRQRLSALRRGKPQSAESVMRRAASNTGKVRTESTKAKISLANKGRVRTKEHARKLSEARRLPDAVVESRIALNNPLFEVVKAHSEPGRSTVRCRHCKKLVTYQNGNLFRGVLPSEHRSCADEIFEISAGTQVYSTVGGYGYQRIELNEPSVPFTYKIAPAGVIFFDIDGNELYRERLPREYTQARITGEHRLRTGSWIGSLHHRG